MTPEAAVIASATKKSVTFELETLEVVTFIPLVNCPSILEVDTCLTQ